MKAIKIQSSFICTPVIKAWFLVSLQVDRKAINCAANLLSIRVSLARYAIEILLHFIGTVFRSTF